jgi:hypothetical protein
MKVSLILNPGHGIRKSKAKTWCVHDVNAKKNYYKKHDKNRTRSWQIYIPKTGVEQSEDNA